jgi:hypothetical protein
MTPTIARLTDTQPVLQVVCAWHTSKPELDTLNRQFPGQISHGICASCAALMMQPVSA